MKIDENLMTDKGKQGLSNDVWHSGVRKDFIYKMINFLKATKLAPRAQYINCENLKIWRF